MRKLIPLAILALTVAARGADVSPRQHLSMDADWRFSKSDATGAQQAAFDDAAWRTLDVPHDWGIEGPLDQQAITGPQGGFAPASIGWYRKRFVTPEGAKDKSVSLTFDGVYMNADVYLNGQSLGHHTYGYTGFTFDLAGKLADPGKDNVLAVRVDNSVGPNSRWHTGSGIYRHV